MDGNEFIDYMCGYGPMILGYAHEKVDEAYRKQARLGSCTSIATNLSVDLAEEITKTIDCADWVMFAKNGADATSMAVMLARGFTKRDKIVLAEEGYHGTQPWAGTNPVGITPTDRADILMVPWGDLNAFSEVIARPQGSGRRGHVHPVPPPGLCRSEASRTIVLAGDEEDLRRARYRAHHRRRPGRLEARSQGLGPLSSASRPDLACYSKAMANGYAISALVGSERLRITASKAYFAGSFWCNAPEMAAAMACLEEMKAIDAPKVVKELGETLMKGLGERAAAHGLKVSITGPPAIPFHEVRQRNQLHEVHSSSAASAPVGVSSSIRTTTGSYPLPTRRRTSRRPLMRRTRASVS
ncbi:MAG: aminotransferase class III-fold pyridoxal phosphate-dependent enzyme [Desulfobacterales bacterium]|nr:aminotransferase class III-fold pyridoxal phosphate-dependent enzyme [Desulfobacterales bacterium]